MIIAQIPILSSAIFFSKPNSILLFLDRKKCIKRNNKKNHFNCTYYYGNCTYKLWKLYIQAMEIVHTSNRNCTICDMNLFICVINVTLAIFCLIFLPYVRV